MSVVAPRLIRASAHGRNCPAWRARGAPHVQSCRWLTRRARGAVLEHVVAEFVSDGCAFQRRVLDSIRQEDPRAAPVHHELRDGPLERCIFEKEHLECRSTGRRASRVSHWTCCELLRCLLSAHGVVAHGNAASRQHILDGHAVRSGKTWQAACPASGSPRKVPNARKGQVRGCVRAPSSRADLRRAGGGLRSQRSGPIEQERSTKSPHHLP